VLDYFGYVSIIVNHQDTHLQNRKRGSVVRNSRRTLLLIIFACAAPEVDSRKAGASLNITELAALRLKISGLGTIFSDDFKAGI
jgi:hypothetical protein